MATLVNCFAIQGIDGYPVDIEIKTLEGQPAISIIGLGDLAVKEAAERIQAAIDESGFVFPKKSKGVRHPYVFLSIVSLHLSIIIYFLYNRKSR